MEFYLKDRVNYSFGWLIGAIVGTAFLVALLFWASDYRRSGIGCEKAAEKGLSECIQEARTPDQSKECGKTYKASLEVCVD
jgi:hypothetical protein